MNGSGEVKVGQSWLTAFSEYPPIKEKVGQILASMNRASEGSIIWIHLDALQLAPVLLEFLSQESRKNYTGFVVDFDPDVELLENLRRDFEMQVKNKYRIEVGDSLEKVTKTFSEMGFSKVKKVWDEGEFSVIGDVMTLWPLGYGSPVRVESFGDHIEKIVLIDRDTRKTLKNFSGIEISPGMSPESIDPEAEDSETEKEESTELPTNSKFRQISSGISYSDSFRSTIIFSDSRIFEDEFEADITVIDAGIKKIPHIKENIDDYLRKGNNHWFVINHNLERAREISEKYIEDNPGESQIEIFEDELPEGFYSEDLNLTVLTDRELWGTVKISASKKGRGGYSDMDLDEISPGDFVVHEDHGIGVYVGSGVVAEEEYLVIKYADKDKLYVPPDQVSRLTKYIGVGDKKPKLTRLGGGVWKRVKKRVEENVQKLASELLRLYAVRELTETNPVEIENGEMTKFEKDFEFEETEDQMRAIEEVKEDLKGEKPMDRLLVGDVGFGKTEVAMRAAFLMVLSGKQVAVLAPTTVLVEQHLQVFRDRMEKFGVKVAGLSRFLDEDEVSDIIDDIALGEVDVVIGTHRLLSKDVRFKDLGLLIIDEEQKFGVAQKEKLKKARVDTHVLAMSATPIPRTLNMALSGVRDVSIIATPPEGRKNIENIVKKFNWSLVKEAIEKEVKRGGQVYFVHNRVSTIDRVVQKLKQLLPEVTFVSGHGQMSSDRLSEVMHKFNEKKADVLVCTTIIENGLDMPNVNTLIVDRAEMFGLSQLYQIRGRIGRGTRQAFAYFLYYGSGGGRLVKRAGIEKKKREESGATSEQADIHAGRESDDIWGRKSTGLLWDTARARLDAIRQLKQLGSGFGIAQRDLEIRGAGNFLGKQQHGSVSSVGFSLYCRLLKEEIEKMRNSQKGV